MDSTSLASSLRSACISVSEKSPSSVAGLARSRFRLNVDVPLAVRTSSGDTARVGLPASSCSRLALSTAFSASVNSGACCSPLLCSMRRDEAS
ncbi:hypothetical protein D3C87_1665720 [compost metagenome]